MDYRNKDYLEILNYSPLAVYSRDLKGEYVYFNSKFQKMFVVPGDFIEDQCKAISGYKTKSISKDSGFKKLTLKQTVDIENYISVDSREHTFVSIKYPLCDNCGHVTGMCEMLFDVSENLKLKLLFENDSELLESALKFSKITDWEYNIASKQIKWSESVAGTYIYLLNNILHDSEPYFQMCPDEFINLKNRVNAALISGVSFEKIISFIDRNSINRMLHISCDVDIVGGKPVALRGRIHDVKELQKTWRNLRERNGCYEALFNNNYLKILIIDPNNTKIVDANEAALSYYGYTISEIRNKKISDINTLSEHEIIKKMRLAVQGKINSFRFKHQLANGSVRDVEVYSGPIVMAGKELLYSMVHDVTEKINTESRLFRSNQLREEIFANINEAIFIIDPHTEEIIDCNHFCYEFLGREYEECVGKKFNTFFHNNELSIKSIKSLPLGCADEKHVYSTEALIKKKDNSLASTECDVLSLCDETNTIYVYICIMRDITKHKNVEYRLEQEVYQRTQEIQDMNTALSVLLRKQQENINKSEASLYRSYSKEILPLLKRLKSSRNINEHELMIKALEHNLKTIFSPVCSSLSVSKDLTPQENRIATMIKEGMTSKEIARAVNASLRTVTTHRENIRNKLGIVNSRINLKTYLSTL
jgi:PAS domain S-box-containing protein